MTSLDPRDLRRAFGSFMTGVTVVTTRDTSGTPLGFTANSFSSVSLDPPLLLVCPGKNLSSYDAFASCEYFAVNILAEGQEDVSNTFAGFKGDRFAKTAHQLDANGVPLLDGAVATFSCRAHQAIEAGDHCILIGEVGAYSYAETRGLGYANGQYFSLGLERGAFEAADRSVVCGAIIECNGKVLLEKTASGYRPPQISLSDHQALRESLQQDLATRGITAQLGAVYSVYDDATTHHVYTLASVPALPLNSTLEAVAIKQLTDLTFATPAIATMMSRFAFESLTRDFSLYLGDVQRGDVHTLSERTE